MTRFLFVGDVAFSRESKSPWLGQEVQEILQSGLTIANVECVLIDEPHEGDSLVLEASPETASWLSDAGVAVASLANNHIMDRGVEGLESTRKLLEARGIETMGAGLNEAQALAPLVLEHQGLKLGLVGRMDPRSFEQTDCLALGDRPGAAVLDLEETLETGRRLRSDGCDFTVCAVHWGIQSVPFLPSWLIPQMDRLMEVFDVVAGSHAHILQPINRRGGSVGLCGQGNFYFAPLQVGKTLHYDGRRLDRYSAIFQVDWSPDGAEVTVHPTRQELHGGPVRLLGGIAAGAVRRALTWAPARSSLAFQVGWRLKDVGFLLKAIFLGLPKAICAPRRYVRLEVISRLIRAVIRPTSR